jgi:hypothetical protein
MAFLKTQRRTDGSGGSGSVERLRWIRIADSETAAIESGVYFVQFVQTPIDSDAILIWFEGDILNPTDWTYDAGTNRVYFDFDFDPATDSESGTVYYYILFPYLL